MSVINLYLFNIVTSEPDSFLGRLLLGKPNFSFQKRQKELAKQKKNEEKRQRKLEKNAGKPAGDQGNPAEGGEIR